MSEKLDRLENLPHLASGVMATVAAISLGAGLVMTDKIHTMRLRTDEITHSADDLMRESDKFGRALNELERKSEQLDHNIDALARDIKRRRGKR